jgi:hypothetical protein
MKLYETESLSGKQRENQPAISNPQKLKEFQNGCNLCYDSPVGEKKKETDYGYLCGQM